MSWIIFDSDADNKSQLGILDKNEEGIPIDGIDPAMNRTIVNNRLFQSAFRAKILQMFNHHCLFCDVDSHVILETAHIMPVSEDIESAGKFSNELLLCPIHHKLFDMGLISVIDDKILVSKELKESKSKYLNNEYTRLIAYNRLNLPRKAESEIYLRRHYENMFRNNIE